MLALAQTFPMSPPIRRKSAERSARYAFRVRSRVLAADALADEMQALVLEAAGAAAGRTIKAQQNAAADALKLPQGHWRIRAAWQGEAGSWSGTAIEEFRQRHAAWKKQAPAPTVEDALSSLIGALRSNASPEETEALVQRLVAEMKGCKPCAF